MRLIGCYIENYGTFSGRDFDFSEGVNDLCENNGFGKSTLASFIKAMFYGLANYDKRTRDFVERLHFYPFGGGKFGGNLTFSREGHTYRIERFFGKNSRTDDVLTVYRDGVITHEFDHCEGELGRDIFGLDKEAFERILFITSKDIEMEATTTISTKLNHLVNATDEASTYEDAIKHIEDTRKELKASRKTERGDALTRTKEEIERIESSIRAMRAISDALDGKYKELKRLKEHLRRAEDARSRLAAAAECTAKWNTHDAYDTEAVKRMEELAPLCAQYPQGLPTEEELSRLATAAKTLENADTSLTHAKLGEADTARLDALTARFIDGVPSEETLKQLDALTDTYTQAAANAAKSTPPAKSDSHLALSRRFSEGVPSPETLAEQDTRLKRLNEIGVMLSAAVASPVPASGKRPRLPYLAAALLSVLLAAGGGVAWQVSTPLCISLIAVGVVGLFATGFLYLLKNQTPAVVSENDDRTRLLQEQAQLRAALQSFLAGYRYSSEGGVEAEYATLKHDLETYRSEEARILAACAAHDACLVAARDAKAALDAALASLGVEEEAREGIRHLHTDIDDYARLTKQKEKYSLLHTDTASATKAARETFDTCLAAYGIAPTGEPVAFIGTLTEERKTMERLARERDELLKKAEDYRREHNLTERPAANDTIDPEALNADIETYNSRIAQLINEIERDEHAISPLEEQHATLEQAKDRLKQIKEQIKLLDAAKECLVRAENALKERYISPVKDRFLAYATPIEHALGERMRMDGNFGITFERGGESRSDRHLSAGQRSICALCYRLALIDNMYENDMPFILMDDPFVHLDAENLENTLALVREISASRQILYFTCHESRRAVVCRPTDG